MRPLAVLDIDGVVADARHRLHHIAGHPGHDQWIRFFNAAADDQLLDDGRQAALRLARDHDIVWMTGRPERIREQTLAWLVRHVLPAGPLYMQPKGDCRLARLVKLEHLHSIAAEHPIAIVLDDDPRVVELLRDEGFPAELATWLPWSPALRP